MQDNILKIVVAIFLILCCDYAIGQGCSDAGFCTINTFKPNINDSTNQTTNQLNIGTSYGNADNGISAFGTYLEYNRQLNTKTVIDFKLTSLAQNGNEVSVFGLSDIYLNGNYRVNTNINLSLGTKIPLSKSNKTKNHLSLPMDYQSSLGTFDLIFGISYKIKKIQIVAALQQPITHNNNKFIAENYTLTSKLREFPSTNKFKRSGDILFRISYPISLSKKLIVTPSILPIYHLTNDKYTDQFNVEREITGSQGLTLNGNIYIDYELNNKSAIQFNAGMPFVVREKRPDGLTRSFIVNLEYSVKF